jgi:hypothetical protein
VTDFLALTWTDLRVLYRTGYVWATVAVFAILLLLALQVRRLDFAAFADVVTAIILLDVVVMPVLLVGLMALLERGEGALLGLAATPLSPWTYLASRATTVSVICSAEMLLVALIAYDGALRPELLVAGLFSVAGVASLTGFVAVSPFRGLYDFILPMIGCVFFLGAPGYATLAGWNPAWLAWHPTAPGLTLLEGAFAPLPPARLAYGAVGAALWLALGGCAATRALRGMLARAAGG